MASAVQRLADAITRHGIVLERLKRGTIEKFIKELRQFDREMVEDLRRRLEAYGETGRASARKRKSLDRILNAVKENRTESWRELRKDLIAELREIAKNEAEWNKGALDKAVAIEEYESEGLPAAVVAGILSTPFLGKTASQHVNDIANRDIAELRRRIQVGVAEGYTAEQIISGIRGSRDVGFSDGALQRNRNYLATTVSSAVNHLSNGVRNKFFEQQGLVIGEIWQSVLDGRTTDICRSRDGHATPYPGKSLPRGIPQLQPPNARPPAHYNCRSQMVALTDPTLALAPHRTTITTTLTVPARRRNFRAEAKRRAGPAWAGLTERQRRRRIRAVSNEFMEEWIGRVPAETTYSDWFSTQSAAFQKEVLGKTKYRLYREGNLSLDKFVDFSGKTLTIEQLRARYPKAFEDAGL